MYTTERPTAIYNKSNKKYEEVKQETETFIKHSKHTSKNSNECK